MYWNYEQVKAWKLKNPDKVRAQEVRYRKKHPFGGFPDNETKKAYNKKWYISHRDRVSQYRRKRRILCREFIENYKDGKFCQICGEKEAHRLVFHHKDKDTKTFVIAESGIHSKNTVMKEIEKYILLCPSCHRKIHARTVSAP
jgi:hypothetical protein